MSYTCKQTRPRPNTISSITWGTETVMEASEHVDGTWPAITCYTVRNTHSSILFLSCRTTIRSYVTTHQADSNKLFQINYQTISPHLDSPGNLSDCT